jgi:hypothetical protein
MHYQELRSKIKSGDLLAWSHRGIRSFRDLKIWMVRLFTRSEYSHVGIAWVVGGRVFVIEAVQPKVRIYPLSKLLEDGCYWIPMDAEWKPSTEELALECVGDEYSVPQAIQAPFMTPPVDTLWQCAEMVAIVLLEDGINLGRTYTPAAIVQSALAHKKHLEYIDAQK